MWAGAQFEELAAIEEDWDLEDDHAAHREAAEMRRAVQLECHICVHTFIYARGQREDAGAGRGAAASFSKT